jgi:hypothetical protein
MVAHDIMGEWCQGDEEDEQRNFGLRIYNSASNWYNYI